MTNCEKNATIGDTGRSLITEQIWMAEFANIAAVRGDECDQRNRPFVYSQPEIERDQLPIARLLPTGE